MEYIIKYNGNLDSIRDKIEILSVGYAIIDIEPSQIKYLRELKEIEYWEPTKKLFLSTKLGLNSTCISPVQNQTSYHLTGSRVIIGIIDSGIDSSHSEFMNTAETTRILSVWDMTTEGVPPNGFYKGIEYTFSDINADKFVCKDFIGHGTAVAGIAAGISGAAPEASIIAVKLGSSETRTTDIMRGIKYIIDKAINYNMPCVINLSYGTNNGSHRGQSLFETYIDDISRLWKTVIVCASGNEGYSGHHFKGNIKENNPLNLNFNVSSNKNNVYLSLWKNFSDIVNFELVNPSGMSTGIITPLVRDISLNLHNVKISFSFGEPNHYSAAQEIYVNLGAASDLMDGIWTLICYGEKIVDGNFDVWLPTIDEVSERTSFLESTPDMTMTLPATAVTPISVGGYRPETDTVCTFSGRGGTMHEIGLPQLDLTAPAENIYTAKSGGGFDTYTGTSMAAPFVSGAAALMMEWGIVKGNDPFLYGQRVKAFLCKNAVRNTYLTYPNPLWGYGKLSLCDTIDDLELYKRRI